MKRNNKKSLDCLFSVFWLCIIILLCFALVASSSLNEEGLEQFVPRDQRQSLVSTEYGEISAVGVIDGINGSYYMQFITLEPNALFLPVILNADMVFYVQTGSGTLGLMKEDEGEENGKKKKDKSRSTQGVDIRRGDVCRLPPGTVLFIQSSLDPERHKLRICAIFANSEQDLRKPAFGPYSSIRDLVLGFNERILQAAFQAPVDVVKEIISSQKPLAIVEAVQKSTRALWEVGSQFVEAFRGRGYYNMFEENKEKGIYSGYNILSGDRDVENCNGWSTTVTGRQLRSLRASNIGVFMVNLTKGAMMGPHWNPMASEIAIVLYGRGMIHVACPSTASEKECKSKRIIVEEGDVFVVPRYHPMAQMSFNNGSLVFFGFTTTNGNSHPQFLAGKRSVLQTFDVSVLAKSFGVNETTIGKILAPQHEAIILECVSCAEEEERLQKEAVEREKEEERKKAEEEAKKIEEERRRREEEAKQREEEAKKREEAKQREEEAKKREEAKQREEEAKKREEEEKRQEEEAREKEEEKKRKEEEEAERREAEEKERKEHEAKKEEQEAERQEEEASKEAEKAIKEEEEKARQREEEARAEEEGQREEQARQEEKRREEEKEAKKRDAEEKGRKEETARQEEERAQEEEAMREAESARDMKEAEAKEREAAAQEEERRKEEERGGDHEEEEEEKESQQQQEEEAAESHEQKEARYWPGGGGEGTILLRKTWTG